MSRITESEIEAFALELLESQGFTCIHGPDIAPDSDSSERGSYGDVVLAGRLTRAVDTLNPDIPPEAREQAIKEVLRITEPDLITTNEKFHRMLTEGVEVEFRRDGEIVGDKVWLVDYHNPANNDFAAVNQFTVMQDNISKRPDILLYVNGLPLVVIELKNAADQSATIRKAFDQLQSYKQAVPALFHYNGLLVVSDGLEAKAGSLSAGFTRFMAWKSIDGTRDEKKTRNQLEVLLKGLCTKERLLDLIRHYTVFEKSKKQDPKTGLTTVSTEKKIAAYHQYFAVNKAIDSTKQAVSVQGDRRCGVVWHTQGSGKSLSMVFYTGKLVLELDNPTVVVITDRNDLDDQLFDTFAGCNQLLRQPPIQADNRDHLQELLKVAAGRIVFTTLQKFLPEEGQEKFPLLSERRNIVVIADEAHRSQYGFAARTVTKKDSSEARTLYGFAKYLRDALPNA